MLQQVQKMQVYVLFPMTQISTEHQDSSESTTMNMDMQSVKNAAEWINDNFEENEKVKVGVCNYPDYPFLVTREEAYP